MNKHKLQRGMAAAMTASMLAATLTGCNLGGKKATLEVSLDHSYSSEKIEMGTVKNMNGAKLVGDKIMLGAYDENYNQLYYLYNPADGSVTDIHMDFLDENPKDNNDKSERSYISSQILMADGSLGFLVNSYVSYEDEDGEYVYEDHGYKLEIYDSDMNHKETKQLSNGSDEQSGVFNFNELAVNPNGGYYASSWDEMGQSLVILDDNFKQTGKVDAQIQYVETLLPLKDGSLLVGYQDNDYNSCFGKIDPATNQLTAVEVEGKPNWFNRAFASTDDNYDAYVYNSDGVYGINLANGVCEEVVNWINSDFTGDYVQEVTQLPDGRFMVCNSDSNYENYDLWVLSPRDPSELKNIKLISMAVLYMPQNLSSAVSMFNRSHDDYRIVVVDYSKYNTDEDYELGLNKLQSDMTSGIVADLICTSSIPYESFCNKGLFLDLTSKASALSETDYFTNYFDSLRYGDKLYQIGFAYSINTLEAKTSAVDGKSGLSISEFTDIVTNLPAGTDAFSSMTKSGAMYTFITNNLSAFVDSEKATCNFDSDDFIKLLELCNSYPEEEENKYDSMDQSDWEKYWAEESYQYINDKVLFRRCYIYDLRSCYRERFQYFDKQDVTMVGFPTTVEGGNGGRFASDFTIAISSNSAYSNQCWEFIESMLADDFQNSLSWNLPVKKSAFEKMAEEAMKPQTYTENGEEVEYEESIWRGDEEVKIPNMPQSYVDEIMDYISNVKESAYYDQKIFDIVNEEVEMYFSGDQSAEQAAAMIQSRTSLYLSEQS